MIPRWRRWAWPIAKAVLGLAILFFVGRQFAINLSRLEGVEITLRPGWVVVSCLLYLAGLGWSAIYWHGLLGYFGSQVQVDEHVFELLEGKQPAVSNPFPPFAATVRAYYLGHFGKYVPGKAWALLMRGYLIRGPKVRLSIAIITAFYEVLTTMASGALLAVLLFAIAPPKVLDESQLHPALFGLVLLAIVGVPLLPGVFNFFVRRLIERLPTDEPFVIRPMGTRLLLLGIGLTSCGWVLLGLSLWTMILAIEPEPSLTTSADLVRVTAMMCLSYVAGFLALVLPSGVGVREGVLEALLAPELAGGKAVATVVVLVLRLGWTVAEVAMGAAVYFLKARAKP